MHPDQIAPEALKPLSVLLAVGPKEDDELADEGEAIRGDDAAGTRARVREIVERRYTSPAQS